MQKLNLKTVSIQGRLASFSHQAASNVCSPRSVLQRDSFAEVFEDLMDGRADLVVVPIENSTYGSVYENYDYLSRYGGRIVAETYVRVRLNLLGLPAASLAGLKAVYSHQIALDQIQSFKAKNRHLKFLPHVDTAGAAEFIKGQGNASFAACASDMAAEKYGLKILQKAVEDNPSNFTRFFAIALDQDLQLSAQKNKTTIQFELGSEAGSLYKTLRSFADRSLALSRIESRPIINTDWDYRFYLDITAGTDQDKLQHALEEMKDYVKDRRVDVLGSYHSDGLPV